MLTDNQERIYKELASHTDWYVKTFQSRVFTLYIQLFCVQYMMKEFSWSQHYAGMIGEPNNMQTFFWRKSEMIRVRDEFIAMALKTPDFLDQFEERFMRAWTDYLEAEEKYQANYNAKDMPQMIDNFIQLAEIQMEIGRLGYMNDAFLSFGEEDWIIKWINKELPAGSDNIDNREQIIADLTTPVKLSFVQEEELARMEIKLQQPAAWTELLEHHATNWHWIENNYFESDPFTVDDFRKKTEEIDMTEDDLANQIGQLKAAPTVRKQRKEEIFKELGLSKELQQIIGLAERLSHITDLRKMAVLRLNTIAFNFISDLAKHLGQPEDLIYWMHHHEMKDIIEHERWDYLRERKQNGMFAMFLNGEFELVDGDDFTELDLSPFKPNIIEEQDSVEGQIAFPGNVTGTAKIIMGRTDFDQFADGDILITNQTTPEFVPLMKKAAAVVTDQGGITCHAAIISRELSLPCIIGTQTATSVFKNGDEITLNGTTGKVSKA